MGGSCKLPFFSPEEFRTCQPLGIPMCDNMEYCRVGNKEAHLSFGIHILGVMVWLSLVGSELEGDWGEK